MANGSSDTLRLQLAMAFGQGAGSMLASPEALTFALTTYVELIDRAAGDWAASRFAFTELVRVAGQIAATRAAVEGHAEIQLDHVRQAISVALIVCPCALPRTPRA